MLQLLTTLLESTSEGGSVSVTIRKVKNGVIYTPNISLPGSYNSGEYVATVPAGSVDSQVETIAEAIDATVIELTTQSQS